MSKLALQLWDADKKLVQIVVATVDHSDNQAIVAHDIILQLFWPANTLYKTFAGFFSLSTDTTRTIVYLTDVQLLTHFLPHVGPKGTQKRLPEYVFLSSLVRFTVDFYRTWPIAHTRQTLLICSNHTRTARCLCLILLPSRWSPSCSGSLLLHRCCHRLFLPGGERSHALWLVANHRSDQILLVLRGRRVGRAVNLLLSLNAAKEILILAA